MPRLVVIALLLVALSPHVLLACGAGGVGPDGGEPKEWQRRRIADPFGEYHRRDSERLERELAGKERKSRQRQVRAVPKDPVERERQRCLEWIEYHRREMLRAIRQCIESGEHVPLKDRRQLGIGDWCDEF